MDNNNEQKKSPGEQIIAAAKKGELKMRPKWHFVLRGALWLVGITAVVMAILYLFSLFLFIARKTGIWAAPAFGWHGVLIFLVSIPWLLVLAVLFFIAVLEILVRHYSFAYRLPLLYSAIAVLLVAAAGSIILAGTPLHNMLSHCPPGARQFGSDPGEMVGPPCGTGFFYQDLGPRRFGNINSGVVSEISDTDFIIINRQEENLRVVVTKKTRLPFGEDFSVGDTVMVIGDRNGNQVEAFGISRIDD